MGLPHIESCCWCLGLEMGARLIAYIHLIISVGLVVLCSVYAAGFAALAGTAEDAGDHVYSIWHKITLSVAIVSCGHVLLAITLLIGVHKRNTTAIRVWVWVMVVLFVAAVLFNVAGVAAFGVSGSGSDMFLAFLEAVVFFGILAYCILCVHSFYLMVKSCEDMEGPNQTQY